MIEVHEGSAGGPVVLTHNAMVRIRKDHRELTDRERLRFLKALSRFLREDKGYERFVRVHEIGGIGKIQVLPAYWWPDLAHRGSGILPWHRAYLLSFERELQVLETAVTLPYGRWNSSPACSENFMGLNSVSTTASPGAFVEPTFSTDNPLANWAVNGTLLTRFPKERRTEEALREQNFFSDDQLFTEDAYEKFSRKQEGNPHNRGHNWTGPWMQNCRISPSDPVFWPFHTGFDRQWAKWQRRAVGRFQPDGNGGTSFSPNDSYDDTAPGCNINPSNCMAIGHHLNDTMWPWNSKVGPGASLRGNRPPADISQGFMGPFATASIAGLWPAQPAIPTPGDLIDYAGITPQRLDMGFAYDDVPYRNQPQQVIAMAANTPGAPSVQANSSAWADREARAAIAIATDNARADAQRIEALQALGPLQDPAIIPAAIAVLDATGRSASLGAAAIEVLSLQMMFGEYDYHAHHAAMDALHKALSDKEIEVRHAALRMLASHNDPELISKLAASLDNPADTSFSKVDAIRGLAAAGGVAAHAASIRKFIAADDNEVRIAAITALAPDAASKPAVAAILADRNQPDSVRSAAIRNLTAGNSEATGPLIEVLGNPQETQGLRNQAASALAATIETHGAGLDKARLNSIASELRTVEPSFAPAVGRALQATERLNEKK